MKRATALRYAHELARRVHSVNGVLATPLMRNEAVRISRIWVFGSTVKGAENPNDLDVLIEAKACGKFRRCCHVTYDRDYFRRFGVRVAGCSRWYMLKWLTRGMKNVSRHFTDVEGVEIDVKVLIYPRNNLICETESRLARKERHDGTRDSHTEPRQ
jgi:predicted nucleotidyltransferase